MTIPKIFLLVLFIAAAGGAWWNWSRQQDLAGLREPKLATGERAKNEQLLSEAQARVRQLQAAQTEAAARKNSRAEPSPLSGADGAALPPGAGAKKAPPEATLELANLARLETTAGVDQGYGALFGMLGREVSLTPDQLGRLRSLLVKRQEVELEIQPGADGTTSLDAVASAFAGIDEQIKQALGDVGYATLLRYENTLSQRNAVDLAARTLDHNATPFSQAQTNQLVSVLMQFPAQGEDRVSGRANLAVLFDSPTSASTITDEAIAAAAGMLSPDQLRALQLAQQHQQAQRKLFSRLAQLQRPSGETGSKAP